MSKFQVEFLAKQGDTTIRPDPVTMMASTGVSKQFTFFKKTRLGKVGWGIVKSNSVADSLWTTGISLGLSL